MFALSEPAILNDRVPGYFASPQFSAPVEVCPNRAADDIREKRSPHARNALYFLV
jgi:hypothetical protein